MAELADALGVEPSARCWRPARRLGRARPGGARLADGRARPARASRPSVADLRHELADEQLAALDAIGGLPAGGELLLEGVAASGKTDVYLAAVLETLDGGRDGDRPGAGDEPGAAARRPARARSSGTSWPCCTPGLSAGERHDEWWRILRGEARVVVGTRTAAFAPLDDLGLIVVDEEHDGGYKSDRTPRYDARWVARRRAAMSGRTRRARHRHAGPGDAWPASAAGTRSARAWSSAAWASVPADRDRRPARRAGRGQPVDLLARAGRRARRAAAGERAGGPAASTGAAPRPSSCAATAARACAAPTATCRSSTTSTAGTLRCHHCGRTAMPTEKCPSCGSSRIRYFGAGTQRVEAELRARFPGLRVGAPRLGRPRRAARLRDDLRRLPRGTHRRAGRHAARRQGPRPAHA